MSAPETEHGAASTTAEDGAQGGAERPAGAPRVSNFQRLLGYRTEFRGDGRAVVSCPLRADLLNVNDGPHGGLIATLVDAVCSISGLGPEQVREAREAGERLVTATISLTIDYLAVAEGDRLVAEGRRTGGGRSVYFAQAEIRDETGRLVATGSGSFRLRRVRGEPAAS